MLSIRPQQMQKFSEVAVKRFEDTMVAQLRESFPRVCAKLTEPALREVIQHGVKTAAQYGIVRQRDVGRYIGVMFMFGPDFEMSSSRERFHAALRNPGLKDPTVRTDALCEVALYALWERTRMGKRKVPW